MERPTLPTSVIGRVVVKELWWSQMMKKVKLKTHDERLLGPSKGEKRNVCDNMTPDLLISQLNFFIQGASKEQSNL